MLLLFPVQRDCGSYRMHLQSPTGPINVLVLNQEEGLSSLVPTQQQQQLQQQQQQQQQCENTWQPNDNVPCSVTTTTSTASSSGSGSGDCSQSLVAPQQSPSGGMVTRRRKRQAMLEGAAGGGGRESVVGSESGGETRKVAEESVDKEQPMETDTLLVRHYTCI